MTYRILTKEKNLTYHKKKYYDKYLPALVDGNSYNIGISR